MCLSDSWTIGHHFGKGCRRNLLLPSLFCYKQNFPMICHEMGTATENIKFFYFYSFFKMRRKMIITHKNHSKYYRLGRSRLIILISQIVPYLQVFPDYMDALYVIFPTLSKDILYRCSPTVVNRYQQITIQQISILYLQPVYYSSTSNPQLVTCHRKARY